MFRPFHAMPEHDSPRYISTTALVALSNLPSALILSASVVGFTIGWAASKMTCTVINVWNTSTSCNVQCSQETLWYTTMHEEDTPVGTLKLICCSVYASITCSDPYNWEVWPVHQLPSFRPWLQSWRTLILLMDGVKHCRYLWSLHLLCFIALWAVSSWTVTDLIPGYKSCCNRVN